MHRRRRTRRRCCRRRRVVPCTMFMLFACLLAMIVACVCAYVVCRVEWKEKKQAYGGRCVQCLPIHRSDIPQANDMQQQYGAPVVPVLHSFFSALFFFLINTTTHTYLDGIVKGFLFSSVTVFFFHSHRIHIDDTTQLSVRKMFSRRYGNVSRCFCVLSSSSFSAKARQCKAVVVRKISNNRHTMVGNRVLNEEIFPKPQITNVMCAFFQSKERKKNMHNMCRSIITQNLH